MIPERIVPRKPKFLSWTAEDARIILNCGIVWNLRSWFLIYYQNLWGISLMSCILALIICAGHIIFWIYNLHNIYFSLSLGTFAFADYYGKFCTQRKDVQLTTLRESRVFMGPKWLYRALTWVVLGMLPRWAVCEATKEITFRTIQLDSLSSFIEHILIASHIYCLRIAYTTRTFIFFRCRSS